MAVLGTIKGRVLVQIGDGKPIEVGTIEFPIEIAESKRPTVSRSSVEFHIQTAGEAVAAASRDALSNIDFQR